MNHLVIFAHPNPASFNHAILEVYARGLAAACHEVRIRGLYATGSNPVIRHSDNDMINRGIPPDDIRQEQDHIRWVGVPMSTPAERSLMLDEVRAIARSLPS